MKIENAIKLKDGEKILRVVRGFWLVHLPRSLFAFLLLAVPFFFMYPLFSAGTPGVVAFVVCVTVGTTYGLRLLYGWFWNAFIITNHRVIDIDQRGFFSRTVSEASYDKIQDVSFTVHGVWGTMFGFGKLDLQTAGSSANLELPDVKDPKDAHHVVTEAMGAFRGTSPAVGRSEKVDALLGAASELKDAEARAFLVSLQEAMKDGRDKKPE
jgi:uncharacterized membrane protein YdbT with pleckstrin-like domain